MARTQRGSIQDVGVGLRSCHYQYILEHLPNIPWFEVLADNYLVSSGPAFHHLKEISKHYPLTLHSVGMSLGSTDPLNMRYLNKLQNLVDQLQPHAISDHLCWISVDGKYANELLPLPYTDEAVIHVANRIRLIQELLGKRILIENVSSYLSYCESVLKEWEFLTAVAEHADCLILLDINNIYVSGYNQNFDPITYIQSLPVQRVAQFHLAGFADCHTHLLDDHGSFVKENVWSLYRLALQRFGTKPTLIEWDNNIPEFLILQQQIEKAQEILNECCI